MRARLRRAILLMTILSLSSAGQITPVKAAEPGRPQAKVRITIYFEFKTPAEPFCAGKKYVITATTMADYDFIKKNGKTEHQDAKPYAILVEASSSNRVVGTILTPKIYSGFDLESTGLTGADFVFQAKKAGSTDLKFTAKMGKKRFTDTIPIKVVDCEYKVNMNVTDIDSRDGVTIWTTGHLETKITGESDALEGTGSLVFESGFSGAECAITYSEFKNATTISGHIGEDDQLTLNFQYQPGQITSQVTCPDGGGGSASQAIDLTNMGIASATFPDTGGTRMIRFTYAGSDMAPGTMIINVEPVEAGG